MDMQEKNRLDDLVISDIIDENDNFKLVRVLQKRSSKKYILKIQKTHSNNHSELGVTLGNGNYCTLS
jgi:hypothetical protein